MLQKGYFDTKCQVGLTKSECSVTHSKTTNAPSTHWEA